MIRRTTRDGTRVLVDRLWPRGLRKENAALTLWLKEIAPSPALRKWFGHDPVRWMEFSRRYRAELARDDLRPAGANRHRRGRFDGFYMVWRLDLWDQFPTANFWVDAPPGLPLAAAFSAILFIVEPFILHRHLRQWATEQPTVAFRLAASGAWVLLALSVVTILGAVAGSHGSSNLLRRGRRRKSNDQTKQFEKSRARVAQPGSETMTLTAERIDPPVQDPVSNVLKWVLLVVAILTFALLASAATATYRWRPAARPLRGRRWRGAHHRRRYRGGQGRVPESRPDGLRQPLGMGSYYGEDYTASTLVRLGAAARDTRPGRERQTLR